MRESLAGNYYDVLHYYGSGNYSKLLRCFRASSQSINFTPSKNEISKYRQRVSFFLNSLGLLEFDIDKFSNFSWSACEGYFVTQGSSKVICVGGTVLINEFINKVGIEHIDFHMPGYQPNELPEDVSLFPSFPVATVSESEAKYFASSLGCRYIQKPAQKIAQLLPPLKLITNEFCHKIDAMPDDLQVEQFFMSDISKPWKLIEGGVYVTPGLYRRRRIDGRFDYLVITGRKQGYVVMRIDSMDWAYLIGLDLLSENIKCQFHVAEKSLYIPRSIRLPVLIERMLVANSFSLPSFIKKGVRIYSRINEDVIEILQTHFPVFNIVRIA